MHLSILESPSLLYTCCSRGRLSEHNPCPSSHANARAAEANPLRSTFDILASPFSVSLHEPTHQSHNARVHHSHPAPCRFHGRPCTLQPHQVRYSIGPLGLEIVADLFERP